MDFTKYSSSQLERILKLADLDENQRSKAHSVLSSRTSSPSKSSNITQTANKHYKPTAEQVAAVEAFKTGGEVIITAYAGAGKTSTLQLIAEATSKRGLYLAFNSATAQEAIERFPENMKCMTTHGQALSLVREQFSNSKLFTSLTPRSLKALHRLKALNIAGQEIDGLGLAFLQLLTVQAFCHSSDNTISLIHVPKDRGQLQKFSDFDLTQARKRIYEDAKILWSLMLDNEDPTPLGHDGYLKLWSLQSPTLDFDFILLDEAQDTNPCVMKVLDQQDCQVIYVGDPYQQIYEWRGAVNAMASVRAKTEAQLSMTFRFGRELAEIASELLLNLGEKTPLRALDSKSTQLATSGKPDVKIARKNATLIEQCLLHQENGERVAFVGVKEDLQKLISSVYELKAGNPAKHPDLAGFSNWEEVVAHAQLDEGADLVAFVSLVRKFGEGALHWALKNAVDENDQPDIVLTSGHRSKGENGKLLKFAKTLKA